MKKVLGIMGSPRKSGNTHVLVSGILEGAKDAGAATEIVLLGGLNIGECDGCHICWEGKPCKHKDDMNGLFPVITQSDVIILGTPVYWYGPTALMKAFLDRFVFFNCSENRPGIKGKEAVLAVPFEENDPETAAPLVTLFEKSFQYLEIELIDKIIVPGVTKRGEVKEQKEIMKKCFKLGQRLV
jgi:multimeric flavodoxin WrbA